MVADAIKSFDTGDRSIVDCALGRLGLPPWFTRVYLAYHNQVGLRLKLAAGLGEPWCRDGGILQGCPLSMVFILLLCKSPGVVVWNPCPPLLLSFTLTICPRALLGAARFTVQYVRAVGQNVSPGKCVFF